METPDRSGEAPQRLDLRHAVRRGHALVHGVLAVLLIGSTGLDTGPRLTMAAVAAIAAVAPRMGPSIAWISRTELVAVVNVIAGFGAFLLLPEIPVLSMALAAMGLAAAAMIARPVVELGVVGLAVALELAKIPIVTGSGFSSEIPLVGDFLPPPLDVIVGSLLQSVVVFAVYAIVRLGARLLKRTQRALIDSEARYRMLTEALPNAALVVASGKIVYANDAAQDLLGDVATPIAGQYLDEVLSEEVIPGLREAMRTVREAGTRLVLDGRPYGDASEAVHLSAAISGLTYDDEDAVMVVVSDISERYAAEQARRAGEARFRAAFDHTATPFILLTPRGRVLDLNQAAVRLFHIPRDEAIGESWKRFLAPDDMAEFTEFAGAAVAGFVEHLQAEASLLTLEGPPLRAVVDATVDRDSDGAPRYFIIQIHDVTAQRAAEDALRRSEERYRSLFERSPVALFRTRPDGEIIDANQALLDLLGYRSTDELLPVSAVEVYADPDERDRIIEALHRDGVVPGHEIELYRADGTTIWVRNTAQRMEVDGNQFFEGSLIDVTARRRADAVLRRAAVQGETVAKLGQAALATAEIDTLFAETAHALAIVLDVTTTGIMLAAEGAGFEAIAGVGLPAEHSLERGRIDALVAVAADSLGPIVVNPSPHADEDASGSAVAVAIRGADKLLGVVVAVDDLGRSFYGDGLHFLRSVANVLAAAIDRHESRMQLEQLVRSKDEFIASISHELRTPLTVVAGMAHELQDQWGRLEESEINELITLMVDQSNDMQNLIEDLLVAARADIGKVAVHPMAMEIAAAVEAVLSALPARQDVSLSADLAPATAFADPTRMRQIVRNLLTNALRYGGTTVTVSTGTRGDEAYIRVHDDGPGIPDDQQEQIFEPYESVHESIGTPGSVGLGLTISRKLARLMDGDLIYRASDGSIFELILPLAAGHDGEDAAEGVDEDTETPLSWSSILS